MAVSMRAGRHARRSRISAFAGAHVTLDTSRALPRYDAAMVSPSAKVRSSLPATAGGTSVHAYTVEDWGLLAVIALIWGSSFLFMELGLRSFAPGVVTLARIGLGVATLALFTRARTPVDREDWGRIALLGTVWTAIPLTLFPIAQQWIDSSVAGMINGAMPIFAVAWSTYLLRRLPGWRSPLR